MSILIAKKDLYENTDSIRNLIRYFLRLDNNEKSCFNPKIYYNGYGINFSNIESIEQSFTYVKRIYDKTDGRQLHHFIINIYKGNYKPTVISRNNERIILRFICDEVGYHLYERGYQCFYVIHEDTQYYHAHVMFNSINFQTGSREANLQSLYNGLLNLLRNEYNYLNWEGIIYD